MMMIRRRRRLRTDDNWRNDVLLVDVHWNTIWLTSAYPNYIKAAMRNVPPWTTSIPGWNATCNVGLPNLITTRAWKYGVLIHMISASSGQVQMNVRWIRNLWMPSVHWLVTLVTSCYLRRNYLRRRRRCNSPMTNCKWYPSVKRISTLGGGRRLISAEIRISVQGEIHWCQTALSVVNTAFWRAAMEAKLGNFLDLHPAIVHGDKIRRWLLL